MFRWLFKEDKWIFRNDNPDYSKYTSFPVNSGYLVQRLIIETKLLLQQTPCTIPLFIAMSRNDETVRAQAGLDFFTRTDNKKNRFILYSNDNENMTDSRITLHTSAKADEHILNMSHVSVPVSPDNAHYGRNGDHNEPLHEPKQDRQDDIIYRGALTPENENAYRIQRLTFNPYFTEMLTEIERFIASVEV